MATVPETSSTLPSLYHSPNGHRLAGGATAARMNAARVGGSFAVWGGLFCFFECGLVYVRRNEDPWNSILSGAAAGGLLSVRHVLFVSGNLALFGAALLVLIEGAGITLNRLPMYPPPEDILQFPGQEQDNVQPAPSFLGVPPAPSIDVQELPVPEPGPTGWFGGLFGMKKNDQDAGGDRKLETLELDLPSTPIPSFDYK